MKYLLSMFLILVFSIISCQISPEKTMVLNDTIIQNGNKLHKNKLSNSLDSIRFSDFENKKTEFLTIKESSLINKELIGKWQLENVQTFNKKTFYFTFFDSIEFKASGEFIIQENDRASSGNWNFENNEVQLKFNEPQYLLHDFDLVNMLPEKQKTSLTFSSKELYIRNIDKQNLILINFIANDAQTVDDLYVILVLSNYKKVQ